MDVVGEGVGAGVRQPHTQPGRAVGVEHPCALGPIPDQNQSAHITVKTASLHDAAALLVGRQAVRTLRVMRWRRFHA